ncbi:PUA domain-containing protein [Halocatena salina]|uniref:Pseudouridine synthase n=1 Tax=Halocatena salina TaxID=2934340 RepID=A0A8T9ZYY1_9EURY|nr:PUA domain-containing protein [Halocatena salina]UPM41935.1 pseudouridine synthase [Halocatena salina]
MDGGERERLRTIADYQFGSGAGRALFPAAETLSVVRTSSGRPQQITCDGGPHEGRRIVSYGVDGRFTLGIEGGRRLFAALGRPIVRVGDESVPFVTDGKNAFAKFVRDVDDDVRPGDEVLITCAETLLAVGRAELSASAMTDFHTGVAVSVRDSFSEQAIRSEP